MNSRARHSDVHLARGHESHGSHKGHKSHKSHKSHKGHKGHKGHRGHRGHRGHSAEVLKGGRSTMPLWEEFSCGTVVGNVATMVHTSAA